jgi:hypothetical protein
MIVGIIGDGGIDILEKLDDLEILDNLEILEILGTLVLIRRGNQVGA